ncbi:hypothetical protein [Cellulomonas soli]
MADEQSPYGASPNPFAAPHQPGAPATPPPPPGAPGGQPSVPGVVFNGDPYGSPTAGRTPPAWAQAPWAQWFARWWWVLAIATLLLTVIGGIVALRQVGDEIADASSLLPGQDSQTYSITERPGWDPLVEHGQQLSDTYLAKVEDGTIFEIVPETQEGLDYTHDFLILLADQNSALLFATQTSSDPDELDAQIQETRDRFDELEQTFLAGGDFDTDISVTDADGDTYTSDGSSPNDMSTP